MKNKLLISIIILFSLNCLFAMSNEIPVQIQTTDALGNIVTGTYNFTINISSSSTCSPVLYSNTTEKTTDSRGIVSYNIPVDLTFAEQYWICYYRDTVLKETRKIGVSPYAFRANVSENLDTTKNYEMANLTISQKITFAFGEIIDNLVNGWLKITGNLEVTGQINATDWSNVSITESQISNLQAYILNGTNVNLLDINSSSMTINGDLNVTGTSYLGDIVLSAENITADNFFGNLIGTWNNSRLYVPYIGATSNVDLGANNFLIDTNTFFVNSTNGRVGIGTTSPGAKLELYDTASSNGLLKIHNAPSGGDCPANMSYINKGGGYCIDNYEAVAMNADGSWNSSSDDNGWIATSTDALLANNGYAGSMAGHYPWVYIDQTEARTACERAGKYLCSSVEWMGAANVGGSIYNLAATISACTVSTNCILGNDLGPNLGDACYGGSMTGCVSSEGVYDMVGNVWEWTNETIDEVISPDGSANWFYINSTDLSYSLSSLADDGTYGKDGTYFAIGTQTNRAVLRGGYWSNGASAGPFCSSLDNGAANTYYSIGFRCCSVPN